MSADEKKHVSSMAKNGKRHVSGMNDSISMCDRSVDDNMSSDLSLPCIGEVENTNEEFERMIQVKSPIREPHDDSITVCTNTKDEVILEPISDSCESSAVSTPNFCLEPDTLRSSTVKNYDALDNSTNSGHNDRSQIRSSYPKNENLPKTRKAESNSFPSTSSSELNAHRSTDAESSSTSININPFEGFLNPLFSAISDRFKQHIARQTSGSENQEINVADSHLTASHPRQADDSRSEILHQATVKPSTSQVNDKLPTTQSDSTNAASDSNACNSHIPSVVAGDEGAANSSGSRSNADKGYECNICFEESHQPIVTRCGHLFCWSCIKLWLQREIYECPVCKAGVTRDNVIPLYGRGSDNKDPRNHDDNDRPKAERPEPPQNQQSRWRAYNQFVWPLGRRTSTASFSFGFFPFGMGVSVGAFNATRTNATREEVFHQALSTIWFIIGILIVMYIIFYGD